MRNRLLRDQGVAYSIWSEWRIILRGHFIVTVWPERRDGTVKWLSNGSFYSVHGWHQMLHLSFKTWKLKRFSTYIFVLWHFLRNQYLPAKPVDNLIHVMCPLVDVSIIFANLENVKSGISFMLILVIFTHEYWQIMNWWVKSCWKVADQKDRAGIHGALLPAFYELIHFFISVIYKIPKYTLIYSIFVKFLDISVWFTRGSHGNYDLH